MEDIMIRNMDKFNFCLLIYAAISLVLAYCLVYISNALTLEFVINYNYLLPVGCVSFFCSTLYVIWAFFSYPRIHSFCFALREDAASAPLMRLEASKRWASLGGICFLLNLLALIITAAIPTRRIVSLFETTLNLQMVQYICTVGILIGTPLFFGFILVLTQHSKLAARFNDCPQYSYWRLRTRILAWVNSNYQPSMGITCP